MRRYLATGFWLVVPILVLNAVVAPVLPAPLRAEAFWRDIAWWIALPENALRFAVVLVPAAMRLDLGTARSRAGLAVYGVGLAAYALSWAPLVLAPESAWSRSLLGLMAPAMTPAIWLAGIALLGERAFAPLVLPGWLYPALAAGFLFFHNAHALMALTR